MGLRGRFFSTRDLKVINSFNSEIMGDIIQTTIILYKMEADQTKTNIYGETDASTGKMFFPGVEITALIDKADIDTPYDEFGPDRNQTVVFKMRENMLKLINIYPEIGDMIKFNERFYECDNIVQEQFLGGVEQKSHSIIVNTHYSRLSKLNFVERQN